VLMPMRTDLGSDILAPAPEESGQRTLLVDERFAIPA